MLSTQMCLGKIDGVNFWDKNVYGVKIVLNIFGDIFGVFLIHLWLKNILKDWIKIYNFVFLSKCSNLICT